MLRFWQGVYGALRGGPLAATVVGAWLSLLLTGLPTASLADTDFFARLEPLQLIDQQGEPFQTGSFGQRYVLFNFIYTNCHSTCPIQTRILAQVQQELPAEALANITFVSLSIDPSHDSPAALLKFANALEVDLTHWRFLTGKPQQIQQFLEQMKLVDNTANTADSLTMHKTNLWLIDPLGRTLQRYQGDPPNKARLIREISQLTRMGAPVATRQ